MISDIRLNPSSRVAGDIADGDAAMEDRRMGDGVRSGSSIPRYLYNSACARASACASAENDSSEVRAKVDNVPHQFLGKV